MADAVPVTQILRVKSDSESHKVAGSVCAHLKEGRRVEIHCIGAAAVNQAAKSLAIVRGYLAPVGIDPVCRMAFADIQIEGQERTVLRFIVTTA